MLRLIDLSLPSPEENLALDAKLFRAVEEEEGGEILRFWESSQPAVVLGHSCAVEKEVIASRCSEDGVPILRRSSGGGAVVLGPGCLVYTLILSLCGRPGLFNVEQSYRLILGRVSRSFGLDRDAMRGASHL